MNARDFNRVFKAAELHTELSQEERIEAFNTLLGFGLYGERRIATVAQAAYVVNYQTMQMNGTRDMTELAETRAAMIRNVTLLG